MLTLDKAIQILSDPKFGSRWPMPKSEIDAMKLLIEAGKRFKALREVIRVPYTDPLPGEDSFIDTSRSEHTIKRILESPPGRESGQ
ncbi:hypothetical protein ES708_18206 [subsurface metagenome]